MMPTLTIGNTDIPYERRFSSKATRKRIVVTPKGVEVIVPTGTAWEGSSGLLAYVDGKRRWVFDAVREVEEKHQKLLTQRYLEPSSNTEAVPSARCDPTTTLLGSEGLEGRGDGPE